MIRPLLCVSLGAVLLAGSPVYAQDVDLAKQAMKLHAMVGGETCESPDRLQDPEDAYGSWTFSYLPTYAGEGEPETEITLFQIFCRAGAYNLVHRFYTYDESEGLRPVSFAVPSFDAEYDGDSGLDGTLKRVTITGFKGEMELINSMFDSETLTVTAHGLWRGVGDASDDGTWAFDNGQWVLKRYEVDASYDGEINPETIVDYTK